MFFVKKYGYFLTPLIESQGMIVLVHSFIRSSHSSLFGALNLYPSASDLQDALTALSRLTSHLSWLSRKCLLSIIIQQNHKTKKASKY